MEYLLDFLLESFAFDQEFQLPNEPVYIIFRIDGSQNAVSTFQKNSENIINWDYQSRNFLQIDNLANAFMYATLCTYSEGYPPVPIGIAKIRLNSFPLGRPGQISFHIFDPNNSAIKVGTITLTANMMALINDQYPKAIPIATNYITSRYQ